MTDASSASSSPYDRASVALAATPEHPDVGADARLSQKAAVLAALTDAQVRRAFVANGGFCCDEFGAEFPNGVKERTKCSHCGKHNELAVCPEPGCDTVLPRQLFRCWGGTCLDCDMMGQGTCVLCRADTPWHKLGGRKWGRKTVRAPLCDACAGAHPGLLPYTCNLTSAEERALNKKDDKPWAKRRRLLAAAEEAAEE